MGYDFRPHEANVVSLNNATSKLETLLSTFVKDVKGYTGIKLIIKRPGSISRRMSYQNPLEGDWYDDYPSYVKDCELRLLITIKGGMLTRDRTDTYAKVRLTQLPACCGVCVMNGMELHSDVRGNGVGKAFVSVSEAFAKVLNYSYVMCTTHKINGPAIGVVECLGYTELDNGFVNARTKNSIRVFGKNINVDDVALTDGYLDLK